MNEPKIAIVAPTATGYKLGVLLASGLQNAEVWTKARAEGDRQITTQTYHESLDKLIGKLWPQRCQLVFILTVGAVVRAIAPFLENKATDPGIVAVDESGKFAISLSGGHLGGGDRLTREVASLLGIEPVITAAAERQHLPAIDLLGEPYGWRRGQGDWTAVAAAIARQDRISVVQTCGETLWHGLLPQAHQFVFEGDATDSQAEVWISEHVPPEKQPLICWHPRVLWVGIGCERGTPLSCLETALGQVLERENFAIDAIAGLASIEIKNDEEGLLAL
ncbi:MAG: cobalamin biosynthesis protein, partial [Cyanobacteria bacterium J06641_5]